MARIVPVVNALGLGKVEIIWDPIAGGDVCEVVALAGFPDKTVTVEGTITTFALEGTNDPASANFRTLTDVDGITAITAAGIFTLKGNPLYVRPNLTTGSATVRIVC